jgi:hypothetical protein
MDGVNVRFVLPTMVAPRYQSDIRFGPRAPDERTSSLLTSTSNGTAEFGLRATFNVTMPSNIREIGSPSHAIATRTLSMTNSIITIQNRDAAMDRDLILLIEHAEPYLPRALVEHDPDTGSRAIQLTFTPQPVNAVDASSLRCEIICLVDRSGSMSGRSITSVRSCLALLLRSLPTSCMFNIISFGDRFTSLFENGSRHYDDESLKIASDHVHTMAADYGGTELFPPLAKILAQPVNPAYPRQIFLLTGTPILFILCALNVFD